MIEFDGTFKNYGVYTVYGITLGGSCRELRTRELRISGQELRKTASEKYFGKRSIVIVS
ncbi:hypothetical protein [Moorena sp. SIO3I6]|uniref:hypothetical protein n=1 Tax=Moorena sp. SIO3I6 TaxID=2607831 RepID=UPI0025FF6E35|nr:hypothetical protein [Moorena sp. SIO3I6]